MPIEIQKIALKRLMSETAQRCFKERLADSYLVCDSETSGTDHVKDFIQQYGFCVVINRKIHSNFSIIINRGRDLHIHPKALEVHGIDHDRMEREGVPVREGINLIIDTFEAFRKQRFMFVGHNLINFDIPFFELDGKVNGRSFVFGPDEVIDTGALVKAVQLGMYYNKSDTLRSFAKRAASVRAKGIFWALDKYCYDTYALGSRSGIKKEEAHDAGIDCLLTHHLLETLREIFECKLS